MVDTTPFAAFRVVLPNIVIEVRDVPPINHCTSIPFAVSVQFSRTLSSRMRIIDQSLFQYGDDFGVPIARPD